HTYLYSYPPTGPLLSFPTRRSSDLTDTRTGSMSAWTSCETATAFSPSAFILPRVLCWPLFDLRSMRSPRSRGAYSADRMRHATRSEEHTSELQSRGHLVCRLLLEKK